jgi:hypothetical protein
MCSSVTVVPAQQLQVLPLCWLVCAHGPCWQLDPPRPFKAITHLLSASQRQ